ncbi:MAG: hypothetical protein NVS2B4_07980 [Ramlibacter sp.]
MLSQMRGEMRAQELTAPGPRASGQTAAALSAQAAAQLLGVYADLAPRGEHLLSGLLAEAPPRQWERMPEDDAVDSAGLYQWFYHCHGPEDRPAGVEHGHIHLFARRTAWERLSATRSERAFLELCGRPKSQAETRHLLAIGLDAKGVPVTLFAVNSWVTGDLMLSAAGTAELLAQLVIDTGYCTIDRMVSSLVRLCEVDIQSLLRARDQSLRSRKRRVVLQDRTLEILAEIRLDLDSRIAQALASPA